MPVELTEAVVIVQSCSVKNVHFSQKKNTYAGVSFYLQLAACNFIKRGPSAHVLSNEFCEVFKNIFFKNNSGRLLLNQGVSLRNQKQTPQVFKKVVLKNCFKYTGRHLCKGVFFNKVAGLGLQLCYKRDSGTDVFKSTFLQNTSGVIASA